jgi:hypothetical protein
MKAKVATLKKKVMKLNRLICDYLSSWTYLSCHFQLVNFGVELGEKHSQRHSVGARDSYRDLTKFSFKRCREKCGDYLCPATYLSSQIQHCFYEVLKLFTDHLVACQRLKFG